MNMYHQEISKLENTFTSDLLELESSLILLKSADV